MNLAYLRVEMEMAEYFGVVRPTDRKSDEYIENRQYDRHRGDAQMWRHGSIEEGDDGRSVISR